MIPRDCKRLAEVDFPVAEVSRRFARVRARPDPAGEPAETRRPRPDLNSEAISMRVVMEHERAQGRQVYDVHEKNLG